jgi:phospholipase C
VNGGGPHSAINATADVNGGKMDGFIAQAESGRRGCLNPTDPACTSSAKPDVMGYHTAGDIPNYWTYAKDFVLQDHMFEPNASWSLPSHLFLVSEWSAYCTQHDNPDIREDEKRLGNLIADFNFSQRPRASVVLAVHPKTTLTGTPSPSQLPAAAKAAGGDG